MTPSQLSESRERPKTGWPPGMLQDDDKKLSKWLSHRIDSRMHAREAAASITLRGRGKNG